MEYILFQIKFILPHPDMFKTISRHTTRQHLIFLIIFFGCSLFQSQKAYSGEEASAPIPKPEETTSPAATEKTAMELFWGEPAMDTLYLGMWSYHFVDDDDEYQTNHNLIGLAFKGFYFGTFENSRDDRAWSGGVQRDVYRTTWGPISMEMGYRAGILYGYEKMQIGNSELFPLIQLYSDIRYKNVGMQFAWAGSAFTAGFLIRF